MTDSECSPATSRVVLHPLAPTSGQGKGKPFDTISIGGLMKLDVKVEWAVEPFFPVGSNNLLAGDSGIGKTWITLDLALSIALGTPWLGQFPVKQGPVLIVDEENALPLIKERLSQLATGRGIEDLELLPIHFVTAQGMNFTPTKDGHGQTVPPSELVRLALTANQHMPVLTIFDSLVRVHRANENAANEMSAVFGYVKAYADYTSSATLFTHHTVKGNGKGGSDRIRGSGDIRAFCDTALMVEADGKEGVKIIHDKARWTKAHNALKVRFESDDEKFFLRYEGESEMHRKLGCADWILELLQDGPQFREDIVVAGELEGHAARTMGDAFKELKERRAVTTSKVGKKTVYRLAGDTRELIEGTAED